jgi:transposase
MGPRGARRSGRALRPPIRSPGRPPGWRREHLRQFWTAIARGLSSEDAAIAVGLSPAVGGRWFRQAGGMRTISPEPPSGRYLSFTERDEIAIFAARGLGVREVASQLGRSPSTISRELRRNAAAASRIGPPRRSGMPTGAPSGPRLPSSRRATRCAPTSRSASPGRSPLRTAW